MSEATVVFIKGWRIVLRPLREEDIPFLVVWINDPQVRRYLGVFFPMTKEEEIEWLRSLVNRKSHNVVLIIEVDGVPIGTIGLHQIDWVSKNAVTGTMLGNKNFWRKGYASEAKMLLLDYAFNTLNLTRIASEVISGNKESVEYAKRCGYVELVRIPKWFYRDGKYQDKVILVVEKAPWKKLWREYRRTYGKES